MASPRPPSLAQGPTTACRSSEAPPWRPAGCRMALRRRGPAVREPACRGPSKKGGDSDESRSLIAFSLVQEHRRRAAQSFSSDAMFSQKAIDISTFSLSSSVQRAARCVYNSALTSSRWTSMPLAPRNITAVESAVRFMPSRYPWHLATATMRCALRINRSDSSL
jgi:hypothetical protein